MSGFHRQGLPNAIQSRPLAVICQFVSEREIASVIREADPFLIDDRCPENEVGHFPIRSAGDTVCAFCSKVFWR